jgi:hypothetical protein
VEIIIGRRRGGALGLPGHNWESAIRQAVESHLTAVALKPPLPLQDVER